MQQITMPRLSDSMEEGTIVRWIAADGEPVAVGAELAEIETDKATMEFQSEYAGVLRILEPEGATLPVGSAIGEVLADGEPAGEVRPVGQPAGEVRPVGAHDGEVRPAAEAAGEARAAGEPVRARVPASPVARRLARQLAVDLASLSGSGPRGRIVKRDVLAADRGAATGDDGRVTAASPEPVTAPESRSAPESRPAPQPRPAADRSAAGAGRGEVTVQEPTRIQATIARRMAEAKASMPEFTLELEVDMDAVVAMRAELTALDLEVVPSFNDFVIRACALALRRHPRANGAWQDSRLELYERVNVGVAVATPDALLVPTVPDADRCSLGEIARRTRHLASAARDGALTPAELSGGTFSVSNLGMFGIGRFTAVLNPPQAAILAVGALRRVPVVRDDAIVPGHRMAITLTCDHRILYGADAARFLTEIRDQLETPLRLAL